MTPVWQIIKTQLVFIAVASEPLEEKEAIVETMEEVNEVLVATAKAVEDFADAVEEKMEDFTETLIETEVSLVKSVETSIEEVDATLKKAKSKLQEIKTEEMVEKVKPRLRRETFENSSELRRVGERPFLLVLLIIVQVPTKMLMLKCSLSLFRGL